MSHSFEKTLAEIIQMYDCTDVKEQQTCYGFRILNNILHISAYNHVIKTFLCKRLEEKPPIDTLLIGKSLTYNNWIGENNNWIGDIKSILHLPYCHQVIKNLIFEDSKRYYSEHGLLIDKGTMSILCYAPGRIDESIIIPEGIITLDYGCFNYNRYAKYITLPSSIRNIQGLEALPELRHITIKGDTGKYITKDGIIFLNDGSQLPYFVPRANTNAITSYESGDLFKRILWAVREKVIKDRWTGIKCNNILSDYGSYYGEPNHSVEIIYQGGFYQQTWYISMNRRARIIIGYSFLGFWKDSVGKCIEQSISYESEHTDKQHICEPLSDCNPCCKYRNNCEAIYRSNYVYARNLHRRLKGFGDFKIDDYGEVEFDMPTTASFEYIKHILLRFLDIAFELRTKHLILEQPLQPSLFYNPDALISDEECFEPFPFNYYYPIDSESKGFKSEIENLIYNDPDFYHEEPDDSDTEDREPPF